MFGSYIPLLIFIAAAAPSGVDGAVFAAGGGRGSCSPLISAAWVAWVRRPKV
jgi:hypothetical protein